MKPENEMTEEVRQLLDSLEEHGKNARRQKDHPQKVDGHAPNHHLVCSWRCSGSPSALVND